MIEEVPAIVLVLAAPITFLEVALKVFQTLNLVHRKVWWIIPTSLLIQACHVLLIGFIAISVVGRQDNLLTLVFYLGLGAGLGSLAGIYIHEKLRKNYNRSSHLIRNNSHE